ncbi:MAG: aldehyde dehydrogenase family protein [Rhodobacteraceae bacterium]|nr:aldehyde dehydrogenase family protein [Paracoccaceae bacterium]
MSNVLQWIDGTDVQGAGTPFDNINPSNGQKIGTLSEATPDQVAQAVAAAGRAFEGGKWRHASHADRRATLRRMAGAIRDNADRLIDLQSTEGGMLPAQVRGHVMGTASWFDYYADFLTREGGEAYRQLGSAIALVEREPIGVCALFSPWNVPVGLSALKLAPALAAGNSVVLKPSEETPQVTRALVDLLNAAGLPKGVLNYVNGRGVITGAALAEAPGVDMISFTGGSVAGSAVAVAAARRHVPSVMELGGKSATIVFDDADLDAALSGALGAIYGNNGQACLSGSRILVHDSIADDFIAKFRDRAEAMVVGDPKADGVDIGPMISAQHQARVLGFYESAKADGDKVLFGGPAKAEGFHVSPGAIKVASSHSRVWGEEVFGPLAAFATFRDEAEAIQMGNDSVYGLSGYLWTRDIGRAMRVSKALRTGTVVVNAGFMRELNAPFGGYKQSGIGREGGAHSWMNFTEAKTTVINHG